MRLVIFAVLFGVCGCNLEVPTPMKTTIPSNCVAVGYPLHQRVCKITIDDIDCVSMFGNNGSSGITCDWSK